MQRSVKVTSATCDPNGTSTVGYGPLDYTVGGLSGSFTAIGGSTLGPQNPPPYVLASFTDPVGDPTGSAPDITDVILTRDASGVVGVQASMTQFFPDSTVTLYLDTDASATTGAPGGYEYAVSALTTAGSKAFGFRVWRVGHWIVSEAPTLAARISWGGYNSRFLVEVNVSDLGSASTMRVRLETCRLGAVSEALGADQAPDAALPAWLFDRMPPPLPAPLAKPLIGAATSRPARPVAGKQFTMSLPVTWSDTGRPVTTGTIAADPTVAGKKLAHEESLEEGKARVSLLVPEWAKHRRLEIRLRITAGGTTVARLLAYAVQ